MKKILLIFAHPRFEQSKTNAALLQKVKNLDGVTFHDLYEHYPEFHIDIPVEKRLLEQHDVIIWHHPFYWYSCPPLMKQWIDLVLEFGWAYGPDGNALKGKKCLQVITTGSSEKEYEEEGKHHYSINDFLRPFEQTAWLCRMQYLPPFAVRGAHRLTSKELDKYADKYTQIIRSLRENKPLDKLKDCIFQNDILEPKKQDKI